MTTLLTMKGFNKQIDYLCFTANTANSTIKLNKVGSPTAVTLETSRDGSNWSTYTFGTTITLSNVGDKIYWRNTSETGTGFSKGTKDYYQFVFNNHIYCSGDISYLLKKTGTNSLGNYCFYQLFYAANGAYGLITPPKLPMTNIASFYCYERMFYDNRELIALPKLPATNLGKYSYSEMFSLCSKIKLSTTQTGEYQTPYRIPTEGTGTIASGRNVQMFFQTGGTFTGNPTINKTYYTSNTVI